jgi:RNA polymerase sigma-70 factor (ECF subfamily)
LVRAKAKIRVARIPYEVPDEDQLAERLNAVLAVIYLVFNEGYSASSGSEMIRADLCTEAIRLGGELVSLMPNESEPRGLLALMLLNDARRQTRTNAQGDIVLLEEQNRSQWDQAKISEGTKLVDAVARSGRVGIYVIQAAIASLHSRAPSAVHTDWAQIASLYALLLQLNPSPVIELNRAVAVAMSEGFEKGLALLEGMELPGYHLLPAAKADLLRRLNRRTEAAAAYREALSLVKTDAERRFLTRRLADVTQEAGSE